MDFLLPFTPAKFPFRITYRDKLFFIGSCFSEEIGNKLQELKFATLQNPNGIVFSPAGIASVLEQVMENKPFSETELVKLNGVWHSWQHHSSFSGMEKEVMLENIQRARNEAHAFLKQANIIFITPGTAYAYYLKEGNRLVLNCHKAPGEFFHKKLLSIEEMEESLGNAIRQIINFNPALKVILTVSPVRHNRDGLVENTRSKARLIELVNWLAEQIEGVYYFPSYELVMDILRDYRFFGRDRVHPSSEAIDFVFEKFSESFFDIETLEQLIKVQRLKTAALHKPHFPRSDAHRKFVQNQLAEIEALQQELPFQNWEEEKKRLEKN